MSLIYTFLFYELAELAALMRMIKFFNRNPKKKTSPISNY